VAETHDKRSIINNALARIGGGEVVAIDEDTDLAAQCNAVYDDEIASLLALYEWSFNARTYSLDVLAPTAANDFDASINKFRNGWRYGFQLPGGRLAPPRRILTNPRLPDQPLRDFAIEGASVFADYSALWATVSVDADPTVWPAPFRKAATVALAAGLCVPVTQDKNLAAALREDAQGPPEYQGRGGMIGQAIAFDAARSRIRAPMVSDPLGDARLA
jgi:hypothetical protein